jgi:hypothetical protein
MSDHNHGMPDSMEVDSDDDGEEVDSDDDEIDDGALCVLSISHHSQASRPCSHCPLASTIRGTDQDRECIPHLQGSSTKYAADHH